MVDKIADWYLERIAESPFVQVPKKGVILIGLPPLSECIYDILNCLVDISQIQVIMLPGSAVYDVDLRMTGGAGEDDVRMQRRLLREGKFYVPDVFSQNVPYGNRRDHWVLAPEQKIVLASDARDIPVAETSPDERPPVDIPSLFRGL